MVVDGENGEHREAGRGGINAAPWRTQRAHTTYAPPAQLEARRAHLISTSPSDPVGWPSMNSSVLASCRFM